MPVCEPCIVARRALSGNTPVIESCKVIRRASGIFSGASLETPLRAEHSAIV